MRVASGLRRLFRGHQKETPARLVEAAGVTVDADEGDGWRRLSGDSRRDLSPLSQERMRETAYYLWGDNLLANRLIELMVAYLLAEGVTLQAADEEEMQGVLNRFWKDPVNDLDEKLEKKVRELALFGEQCWPVHVNEVDGHVRLSYLDPSLIATVVVDPDNSEQPIGIVTVKDRKGQARRYRVIVNGGEDVFTERTQQIRQTFEDGDCFFFCINDLSVSRRGRSDLRASADWVDAYDQFLFSELERYNFLRAFIWDVKLTGASPEAVKERAASMTPPSAGSVRVHNDSEEWSALNPQLGAYESTNAARLFRNQVLGGGTIPEHWFGGGGDVNRSTGESMAEPTLKVFTMRQKKIKRILEKVARYVLRQYIIATSGREPDYDDPRLDVEAVFPEMTARDTTKYAAALMQVVSGVTMAVDSGKMSDETAVALIGTVAAMLGVRIDPVAELAAAREAAGKRREEDTFTGPAPDDLPGDDATPV